MLDVLLVVRHALRMILVLLKNLGLVEIEATFAELAIAFLDMSIGGEEHQYAALYTLVQFEEEATEISKRLLHILVLKVELELATHEV